MTKTFDVWKRDANNIPRHMGLVQADNHVQADNKARMLYGHKAYTKEREWVV